MTTTAIEATGLSKRFRRRWALRDCTLAIPSGSITGLVGPNGAGKSTLMRICAGLARASSGRIAVCGIEVHPNGTAHLPKIGYLDQFRPRYRGFRVDEAIRMGRGLNGRWNGDVAYGLIGELGISSRARLSTLSEGQAAIVAVVLCLAKMPEVLVLDEPLASLDPFARQQLLRVLLEGVTELGTSVLLSSHIVGELEPVCDHLVLLDRGHVKLAGTIDGVLAEHHLIRTDIDARPLASGADVVSRQLSARQSTVLLRGRLPELDVGTEVLPTSLEEIVLAYLANGSTDAPRPSEEGAFT